jgi:chromosome segregation ATPase
MKINKLVLNEPKDKNAALNCVVGLTPGLERVLKRKEHIMADITTLQEKILGLQEHLDGLRKQLSEVETLEGNYSKVIADLRAQWSLTEVEIAELKSRLLQEQIQALEAKAATVKGSYTVDSLTGKKQT